MRSFYVNQRFSGVRRMGVVLNKTIQETGHMTEGTIELRCRAYVSRLFGEEDVL